jgi:hypothetical protein
VIAFLALVIGFALGCIATALYLALDVLEATGYRVIHEIIQAKTPIGKIMHGPGRPVYVERLPENANHRTRTAK